MIEESQKLREDYMRSLIGTKIEVLFENEIDKNRYQGYTKGYVPVRIKSQSNLIGKSISVTIKEYDKENDCLIA
jgi:tRNA A37 methylthiotransferase MiaB